MSSDTQRDMVEVLKSMNREMRELNRTFQKIGKDVAKGLPPIPQSPITSDGVSETVSFPVLFDWESEPIRGHATVTKGRPGIKIEIWVDDKDLDRAANLIDDGFLEGMTISSVPK